MIGTVLSGRYKLESKLGSGGMSTVFLALDTTLDRQVAVKVMHREMSEQEDQLARFRAEARAVARMSHPHVVAVIDAGEDGGHPYIVFEYVEGETLKQRIQREGRLPVQEAVAYAIEIGQGVEAAHKRGLVHRDIKPQNVLIDLADRAKVTDFGIARQIEQQGMTQTGRVLGTTDYVSPEQALGRDVDPRSDVYSLGVVLYEMLLGDVPFHAESVVGVAMKHVHDELPDVQKRRPEVSSVVIAALEKATAKDPDRRYQDMGEFVDDLEGALEVEAARAGGTEGQATSVLDAVPGEKRKLARANRPWGGIALIVLGLVIAGVAAALIASGKFGGGGGQKTPPGSTAGKAVAIKSATDFDPVGGDGEHPESVGLATDGNPTGTSWGTEIYDTGPSVAAAKGCSIDCGVGIYLDAGSAVKATALEITTPKGGWDTEVRAANSPSDTLDGWTVVGKGTDLDTTSRIPLDTKGKAYRYYLIWITKLVSDAGGYRVEISDAKLLD